MTYDAVTAWAAYLLSGWWDHAGNAAPPLDAVDITTLIERLRRNGVPLLPFTRDNRPSAAAILASAPFLAELAEDQDRMDRYIAAFAEVRDAWKKAEIPALFVKAMGPPPTFPYVSNNLDILVPTWQEDEARLVVRHLGFVELRHIEEPHKFLLRRYHRGESAFDLHIHGRLEWHTEFVDSQAVWRRATVATDCNLALMPCPEDGLLIALAHAIYENKALKLVELGKLIYAARVLDVDWDQVIAGAAARGWLNGCWAALFLSGMWEERLYGDSSLPKELQVRAECGTPAWLRERLRMRLAGEQRDPVRIGFVNSKRLFYAKMLADPSLSPVGRARDVASHTLYGTRVRIRLRSQRPMLVAFDGIDGSGKSVQAEFLKRALDGAGLRCRVVWTRGGSSEWLRPLRTAGRWMAGARLRDQGGRKPNLRCEPGQAQRGPEDLFARTFVRRLWPWVIAFELVASYTLRIRWPLLRGEVVVADRYLLSALIELGARLQEPQIHNSLPGRILRALAPRASEAYWFDIPVAEALTRKDGDESADLLARQADLAQGLGELLGATRIDAHRPLQSLSDQIVTEVIGRYEDRHRTALNWLFWANPRPLPAEWHQPLGFRGVEPP